MTGKAKFKGQSTWINQETGEIRIVDEFEKTIGRKERFMITYLAEIIELMETLGNKKMQVVKYILSNMDKNSNILVTTTRELANNTGVSHNTVLDTLKQLEKANIIHSRIGVIMVSPKLMNNKKASGEATMMIKYKEFGGDK
jgi:DNA-binding transcriptional regulator YhcF (GntR family)